TTIASGIRALHSDLIADAEDYHPLIAPDPPVLVFLDRYKVQGFYGMPDLPGSDDPLSLEDDKYHGVWFRMRRDLLSCLKANHDNVRSTHPDEIFLHRGIR
ncbi:MAG TPA: hypothetical protein PLE57_09415, partial [Methanoregulaceae archaeon]|nr:hypothetical protein [Methanoregulaceae archaeon]